MTCFSSEEGISHFRDRHLDSSGQEIFQVMQSAGGQYGLTDMQQFILGRGPSHMFPSLQAHQDPSRPILQHPLHPNLHAQQQVEALQLYHHQGLQGPQQQQQQHEQQNLHHQLQQQQQAALFSLHQHQSRPAMEPALHLPLAQQMSLGSESSEMISPLAIKAPSAPSPAQFKSMMSARDSPSLGEEETDTAEDGDKGIGGSRWPREETLALLRIRSEMDAMFRETGLKGPLWEEVSRKLAEAGYLRSAKKCKEKFENVHKYYKKTKDGRSGRQEGKTYRFCSELEAIYAANNEDSAEGGRTAADLAMEHFNGGGGGEVSAAGLAAPFKGAMDSWTSSGENYDENRQASHAMDEEGRIEMEGEQQEEDDEEEEEEEKSVVGRKRKRKSWRTMKAFFENLGKRLMEQQDELHRKFLEAIERREEERAAREEAYKRQEVARARREQELRAQEQALAAARDAALVAFLQRVTGETLHLPVVGGGSAGAAPASAAATNTPCSSGGDLMAMVTGGGGLEDVEGSDAATRRWPKVEVLALIRLRTALEPRFQEAGPKAQLWEEVAASMACMGFARSAKRCKEKWENINKYFRKTKDKDCSRKRLDSAKTCPYFRQLEALYDKGILSSPSSNNNNNSNKSNRTDGGGGAHNTTSGASDHTITTHHNPNHSSNNNNNNAAASTSKEEAASQYLPDPSSLAAIPAANVINSIHNQETASSIDHHRHNHSHHHLPESKVFSAAAVADSTTASQALQQQQQQLHSAVAPDAADGISNAAGADEQVHLAIMSGSSNGKGGGSSSSSLPQVEGFMREMLELQAQQQHQKLVDEYERLEHEREMREQQQQQQHHHHHHPHHHEMRLVAQERSSQVQQQASDSALSSRDSATLMALVHKLAGHPPELMNMATSSRSHD